MPDGNLVNVPDRENYFARRIAIAKGESGYFSTPSETLDPNLFNGDVIRPEVRQHVLTTLYNFLLMRFNQPLRWSRVWLAGSGVSYQWAAARGNGDLDCLFGIDWVQFRKYNPDYTWLGDDEIGMDINTQLKINLWPQTAHTRFGKQTYELTFYVNPAATDIRAIQPYAAYDLTKDNWTVRPPKLPKDPATLYPREWLDTMKGEERTARQIVSHFNRVSAKAGNQRPGSAGWINAMAELRLVVSQAEALYQSIHGDRRYAFRKGAKGYSDYWNYRWQSHKANGVVNALQSIIKLKNAAGWPDITDAITTLAGART